MNLIMRERRRADGRSDGEEEEEWWELCTRRLEARKAEQKVFKKWTDRLQIQTMKREEQEMGEVLYTPSSHCLSLSLSFTFNPSHTHTHTLMPSGDLAEDRSPNLRER